MQARSITRAVTDRFNNRWKLLTIFVSKFELRDHHDLTWGNYFWSYDPYYVAVRGAKFICGDEIHHPL